LNKQIKVSGEHKERAAQLQKELDEAKTGEPPSADREKHIMQMAK
jgi:hypothetical protein